MDAEVVLAGGIEDIDPGEPKSSAYWLAIIEDAEEAFGFWQTKADSIDKLYASLKKLAADSRDRQFQLFWANIEVLKPSIYARPPVPVVVPKFKDRRPLFRTASELLERCCIVTFDLADIDAVMRMIRDDVAIVGRGSPWVRYETKGESDLETERVCVEHKDRRDFLHEPARKWAEVGWVAAASYLTKAEMRKRFGKASGDIYLAAEYTVQRRERENGASDERARAKVWEIWSKDDDRVYWVAQGCEKLLDEGKPHLRLEGFFPCPRPAYATLQRGSLVPVPDMVYYRDQLEEINTTTARIHALADAIKVRGFYPAGAGEIGDAVETALKSKDDRQVLIPISSWAAFGAGSPKDVIVWLPIDVIAETISQLVELRRQIIDDVYQIMGLSDIMRGATDPKETLGAQQLKSQYGSVRIRDKQNEMVRVARDIVRLAAEIMAENFAPKTMMEMSQMEIPTNADVARQVKAIESQAQQITAQVQQAQADPQAAQMAQANPEQAQAMLQQAQQHLAGLEQQAQKAKETVTIEQVTKFLRDQKLRPFALDIETDSTIQPNEDAEKQRRTEFMTMLGTTIQQLSGLVQVAPQAAKFAGEALKFAVAPFRGGRELDAAIEEFADQMSQQASQPKPNAEEEKAKAQMAMEQQRIQADMAKMQAEQQMRQQEIAMKAQAEQRRAELDAQSKALDADIRMREAESKERAGAQKHQQDMAKGDLEIRKLEMEIQARQQETAIRQEEARARMDMAAQQSDIRAAEASQKAEISAVDAEQRSRLAQQRATNGGRP